MSVTGAAPLWRCGGSLLLLPGFMPGQEEIAFHSMAFHSVQLRTLATWFEEQSPLGTAVPALGKDIQDRPGE